MEIIWLAGYRLNPIMTGSGCVWVVSGENALKGPLSESHRVHCSSPVLRHLNTAQIPVNFSPTPITLSEIRCSPLGIFCLPVYPTMIGMPLACGLLQRFSIRYSHLEDCQASSEAYPLQGIGALSPTKPFANYHLAIFKRLPAPSAREGVTVHARAGQIIRHW